MSRTINPPLIYKAFILLMIISLLLPLNRVILFPYNLSGLLLFCAGIYIAVLPKKLFLKTNTPMSPSAMPLKLHVEGIYSKTRNPMYLGIVIGLFGIAVLTGVVFNIIYPAAYYLIMNNYFIKIEEANLEREFGEIYREYKSRTRRWI